MSDLRPYDESQEHRRRIREAIDACRPAPEGERIDDLDQLEVEFLADHLETHPEDRRRLEQVQKFDRQVRDQIANVPVPAELSQRLFEKLGLAEEPDQTVDSDKSRMSGNTFDEAVAGSSTTSGALQPLAHERRGLGRKLFLGIAAAAAITFVLTNWLRPTPPLLKGDVHRATLAWVDQNKGLPTSPISDKKRKEFPPSSQVIGVGQGVPLTNFLGRKGVMYPLRSAGLQAKLLVVKIGTEQATSAIPTGRPSVQPYTTQGLSLLVWREADLLYVLIVPDDPTNHEPFRQFLDGGKRIARLPHPAVQLAAI